MIISSILLLLLSNAVTLRRDKSILYSRISIIILLYSCLIGYNNLDFSFLENGIGLFGGLFHATCITNIFHIFILLLSSIILVLTAFYPRNLKTQEYSSLYKLIYCKLIYYETSILNNKKRFGFYIFINRITKLWTLSIVYNIQKFRISHFWWSYVFFIRWFIFLFYIIKYKFVIC